MAITTQGVNNFGLRLQLFCLFTVLGIGLTCWSAWNYESRRLDASEQPFAAKFAAVHVVTKTRLFEDEFVRSHPMAKEYFWIWSNYPASARRMQFMAHRVLFFPWPLVGLVIGLGAFLSFSKLLEMMKGGANE